MPIILTVLPSEVNSFLGSAFLLDTLQKLLATTDSLRGRGRGGTGTARGMAALYLRRIPLRKAPLALALIVETAVHVDEGIDLRDCLGHGLYRLALLLDDIHDQILVIDRLSSL